MMQIIILNQVHCFLAFSRASLWLRTPPNVCALAESVSNGREKMTGAEVWTNPYSLVAEWTG